jgi:hypothetical protein
VFDAQPLLSWREVMAALRPKIEKALRLGDYATYNFDNLVLAVERERLKLFYRCDAVVFVEMSLFPQVKVLVILLAAGRLKSVLELVGCAEAWGKAMGCTKVWSFGRTGWLKTGMKRGWRKSRHLTMWKEI